MTDTTITLTIPANRYLAGLSDCRDGTWRVYLQPRAPGRYDLAGATGATPQAALDAANAALTPQPAARPKPWPNIDIELDL